LSDGNDRQWEEKIRLVIVEIIMIILCKNVLCPYC
jgi:hypothetical protein